METFSIQEGRRKTKSGSTEEARREQTGEWRLEKTLILEGSSHGNILKILVEVI